MNIEELKQNLISRLGNIPEIEEEFSKYNKSINTFGELELLEKQYEKKGKHWKGLYKCSCGNKKVINNATVRDGRVKTCGACNKTRSCDFDACGMSTTPEYRSYYAMRQRCENVSHPAYNNYGGRGIKVDQRWIGKDGFRNFLDDMGLRIDDTFSLDRIDVNKGYSKENCRWATSSTQQSNRRGYGKYSKYAGISFDAKSNKWTATIKRGDQYLLNKRFDTEREAMLYRNRFIRRHSIDSTINPE